MTNTVHDRLEPVIDWLECNEEFDLVETAKDLRTLITEQQQEIDRLREALEDIRDWHRLNIYNISKINQLHVGRLPKMTFERANNALEKDGERVD